MNTKTTMTDEEHEQLEARRKHGAKGTAYLPPADKSAHTPGPWHTMENYKGGIPLSVASYHSQFGNVTVARVDWLPNGNGRPSETCRANARLIAAAPELLAAAIAAANDDSNLDYLREETSANLRAAIAKAEGSAQ